VNVNISIMAITDKQLKEIGFTALRDSKDLIKPVGQDLILTVRSPHIYLNGMYLINIECIDKDFLNTYLDKVIQSKRRKERGNKA